MAAVPPLANLPLVIAPADLHLKRRRVDQNNAFTPAEDAILADFVGSSPLTLGDAVGAR